MDKDELIRSWIAEGLSDDEILARLRESSPERPVGPVRSFIRGLPGYETAKKITGFVTDTARNLPGIYDQYATGFGNVAMAIPEGAMRLYGMGEQADKIGAERERQVAEAGPPEGFVEGAARFGGTVAPYAVAGYAAGPNLLRGLAVDMAMDVPVAAADRDMSLAGMAADIDPEAEGLAGFVREAGEATADSPALRGIAEGAAGLGLGLAVAKGLPAGYRALREMGEEGHVIGRRLDDAPPPKEVDTGPTADVIDTALTTDTPEPEAGALPMEAGDVPSPKIDTPALPKLESPGHLRALSEISPRAYRETSLDRVEEFLPEGGIQVDVPEVFMANTENLALGQGRNKGVLLEFDTEGLRGKVNTAKPGWEAVYDAGEAELVGRYNSQGAYRAALRRVVITPGAEMSRVTRRRLPPILRRLEQAGWEKRTLDDGRVQYTRTSESGAPEAGALPMDDAVTQPIRAYHGSPHDFDRFSMEKIGSGEGAQSYGHGLYFAENPEVARSYRDALSPGAGVSTADTAARALKAVGGDYDAAMTEIEARIARLGSTPRLEEVLRLLRERAPVRGRMYEVGIHAKPDEFLDWDAPLSQQSGPFADMVRALPRFQDPDVLAKSTTGEAVGELAGAMGGRAEATKALREAGIPGIRYLDRGSRGAGQGTHNYVVFDDALVRITNKGAAHPALLGPLVGAGAGATAGAATEEEPSAARILGGAAIGASLGMGLAGFRQAADDFTLAGLTDGPPRPHVTPTQQALDAAGEVKLPTFGLDPSGTERLQRHIARIIDTSRPSDLRRAPVSWEETKALARDIGLDPADLDKKSAMRLTGAETLALRDLVAQNIDDIARLEKRLVTEMSETGMPLTPGEIGETQRLVSSLESQNDRYLRSFLRSRSEAGRTLNNLKILANRTLDPAAWMAKAEKIKGSPLDEFQARQLRRLLASGDRLEVAKFVGGLYQAPVSEKLTTLWKAGLLSNPATHLGNMVGNFTMATLETLKDAPAALFDRVAAQISDVRAKGGISADVVAAGWRAADFRGAARQVITGDLSDASVLSKYDVQRQVSFDNWPASAFLNAYAGPRSRIFASLSAGDRIFRSFALGRSLQEQATLMAKAEGLAGDALTARIDELINTDSALHARAIVDAEVATFLNKGTHTTFRGVDLAEAGEGLRRHLGPLGHIIAPFVRTPANIMDRVLEYSPVGYLADLPKMADWLQKIRQGQRAGGLTPQDLAELMALQREMVEQAGRATVGTAVILAGYVLAEQGLLTGNYPSDAAERNVHELLNEQPHSIKVGEHWLSLDRVSPVGNLLTLGAEIHKMAEDPESGVSGAVMAAPAVLGKTVVEQSFLRGVQGGLEALSAPERSMASWVRTTVASAVPAAVYAAARATDPVIRDPQTVGEAVRARLPGLSQTVAPRISGFGEDRVRDTSLAGRVGQVASPFTMRESEASDPVKDEVARVMASIAPYRPRGVDRGTPYYTELQRAYGEETREAVERAIASGEYARLGRRAERLVETDSEYLGRDVEEVTRELMAEYIENAVRNARAELTGSLR